MRHCMRTSRSSYGITELHQPAGETPGTLALGGCPGTRQGTFRQELLAADAQTIVGWGATAVISLIEAEDFEGLDLDALSYELRRHGVGFLHLPIGPEELPDEHFERSWERLRPRLLAALRREGRLLVACPNGRRGSGIVAGRLLVDAGAKVENVIAALCAVRPSALDRPEKVQSLRAYARRH